MVVRLSLPFCCELPAPLESLDAAAASGRPLDARVCGVTARADFDDDLAPVRAGREGSAARAAADGCERELRVDLLHGLLLLRGEGTGDRTTPALPRK